jgi:Tfp pilus assembly protein PilV
MDETGDEPVKCAIKDFERRVVDGEAADVLSSGHRRQAAFTLLEVVIALAIFFIAVFAILDLTSQCLRSARSLRNTTVNATSLAAELCMTNRLEEGFESGDFGDLYPGYTWAREIYLAPLSPTNGLYQVDFVVLNNSGRKSQVESKLTLLLYRPESGNVRRAGGARR